MKNSKVNRALVLKSLTKMVADKEAVRSYLKGTTDIKSIENRGVKFASPI
jgi:hypothetical protein